MPTSSGLQEAFGKTRKIARMLGWYASPRLHMVSRFPIVHPEGSRVAGSPGGRIPEGAWGYVVLGDGAVAAIAQTHTPWSPSGMYVMLQGGDEARGARRRAGQDRLAAAAPRRGGRARSRPGCPRSSSATSIHPRTSTGPRKPSTRSGWQPPTLDPPGERYVVQWPVTVAMEAAGFHRHLPRGEPRSDRRARVHRTACGSSPPAAAGTPGIASTTCTRRDRSTSCAARSWGKAGASPTSGAGPGPPTTARWSRPSTSLPSSPRRSPRRSTSGCSSGDACGSRSMIGASPGRTIGLWARGEDPASGPARGVGPGHGRRRRRHRRGRHRWARCRPVHRGAARRRRCRRHVGRGTPRPACSGDDPDVPAPVRARRADRRRVDRRPGQPLRLAGAEPQLLRSGLVPAAPVALRRRTTLRGRAVHDEDRRASGRSAPVDTWSRSASTTTTAASPRARSSASRGPEARLRSRADAIPLATERRDAVHRREVRIEAAL